MDQKRRRAASLSKLVDTRGLSHAALRQVVSTLTGEEISSRNIVSISKERFNMVKHTMRLAAVDGGEVAIDMCHPLHLLALVVQENDTVRHWYEEAWRSRPSSCTSKWRLLIGWDEFVPGNKMAIQNSRKTMVLNFSFLELHSRLHHDAAWITPLAIRASVIQKVSGGWSAVLRAFLRLLLVGPQGLHSGGHPVAVGGDMRLLYASVHTLLSDGDGLRQALQWLGANATKPCWRHWNVLSPGSDMADRCTSGRRYVEGTCTDASTFCRWSGADMRQAAGVLIEARRRHEAGEIPFARVEEIQRAYGFKFTAEGLIADHVLGAIVDWPTAFQYDWVHVMLSGGVLMSATWSLLSGLEEFGLPGQAELHTWLSAWQCPKASQHGSRDAGRLARFFDARSRSENMKRESIRCGASELLAVARALEEFVETQVPSDDRIAVHKSFFLAARDTVELLLRVKRGEVACAQAVSALERQSGEHIAATIALHGAGSVTPKFHWCFDIAEQLRSADYLMDAFVIERLHLRARDVADRLQNTTAYEATLCAGLVNKQINSSAALTGLEGNSCQMPRSDMSSVRIADSLYSHGRRFAVDDFVQRGGEVGIVLACAEEHGVFALVVAVATQVAPTSRLGRRCTFGKTERRFWYPADTHSVAAWRRTGREGEYIVLL